VKLIEVLETYGNDNIAAELLNIKGKPVAYYPLFASVLKGVNPAIFICQFMYWHGKETDPEGWIYKTVEQIREETGLSKDEQQTARRILRMKGLLEEKKKGLPPVNHYRVSWNKFTIMLCEYSKGGNAVEQKSLPTMGGNPAQRSAENPRSLKTETTRERTAENTIIVPDFIPKDSWEEFVAHRKRKRAPVTERVASMVFEELRKASEAGIRPKEAIEEAIYRNWTAIKADWLQKKKPADEGYYRAPYWDRKLGSDNP
jgi:hypothetical protein